MAEKEQDELAFQKGSIAMLLGILFVFSNIFAHLLDYSYMNSNESIWKIGGSFILSWVFILAFRVIFNIRSLFVRIKNILIFAIIIRNAVAVAELCVYLKTIIELIGIERSFWELFVILFFEYSIFLLYWTGALQQSLPRLSLKNSNRSRIKHYNHGISEAKFKKLLNESEYAMVLCYTSLKCVPNKVISIVRKFSKTRGLLGMFVYATNCRWMKDYFPDQFVHLPVVLTFDHGKLVENVRIPEQSNRMKPVENIRIQDQHDNMKEKIDFLIRKLEYKYQVIPGLFDVEEEIELFDLLGD
jgi:hypothetical protein